MTETLEPGAGIDWRARAEQTRTWAEGRITQCRAEEAKFTASSVAIDAAIERMALLTVLRLLRGERT